MKRFRLLHKFELLSTRYRLGLSFLVVTAGIVGLDLISNMLLSRLVPGLSLGDSLGIGFAPEVWLAVVGLTLGTLVIVISIAAQTIPKIADLYRKDWNSLFFIWFLMGGSAHAVYLKVLQDSGQAAPSSLLLNLFCFLPIAILSGFPYVLYVLKNIQPETVINIIIRRHSSLLHGLSDPAVQRSFDTYKYRRTYHRNLLDGLNQLESIFGYVAFKEPKAQIIQSLGNLLQEYIWMKSSISQNFFAVSAAVEADIAFQTMTDQLQSLQHQRTLYEQKCFRVLGNAYISSLESQDFDLASLCGAKVEQVGLTAIQANDTRLLDATVIRMNTLMRFALKHGQVHGEARHLYNLVYHYRRFIEHLIDHAQPAQAKRCVFYLRSYGNEAYRAGLRSPSLLFIVDVIAAEMRTVLIRGYHAQWSLDIQRALLEEFLLVDSPPELTSTSVEPNQTTNSGVRTLQISLALFYLRVEMLDFVDLIIDDILDDRAILGAETFQAIIDRTCRRLEAIAPDYWEATDRGTQNIFFTEDTDYLPNFMQRLASRINT
ncbi:MAG: hypothetical protein AAGB01_10230 [Cyanobacteria bacterium P01_F01_bin.42]